jgi:hypothetical protein
MGNSLVTSAYRAYIQITVVRSPGQSYLMAHDKRPWGPTKSPERVSRIFFACPLTLKAPSLFRAQLARTCSSRPSRGMCHPLFRMVGLQIRTKLSRGGGGGRRRHACFCSMRAHLADFTVIVREVKTKKSYLMRRPNLRQEIRLTRSYCIIRDIRDLVPTTVIYCWPRAIWSAKYIQASR